MVIEELLGYISDKIKTGALTKDSTVFIEDSTGTNQEAKMMIVVNGQLTLAEQRKGMYMNWARKAKKSASGEWNKDLTK